MDDIEDKGDDQFEISDGRSVDEVFNALLDNGLQPVMSDYIYVWNPVNNEMLELESVIILILTGINMYI